MKLLILIDWFTPAYKAGGPIRSCHNLSCLIKSEREIFVLTSDADLDGTRSGMENDKWIELEPGLRVRYLSSGDQNKRTIFGIIRDLGPDIIYLNGMFSWKFTLIPLWLRYINKTNARVIMAPRGMLQKGALQFKKTKKKAFLAGMKYAGAFRNIHFHATDEQEKADIIALLGMNANQVSVIPNVPVQPCATLTETRKVVGAVKFIFVSRVSRKKNLKYILALLPEVVQTAEVEVTIIGGNENRYWEECQEIIESFPENIRVHYLGPLPPSETEKLISDHHFLILPTHGENFGHAIFESFAVGRPVLISDQTPWRNLAEKQIGFDLPLEDHEAWREAIGRIIRMDQEEYNDWCRHALEFAHDFFETSHLKERYLQLFS